MSSISFTKPLVQVASNTELNSVEKYFVEQGFKIKQSQNYYIVYGYGEIEGCLSGVLHLYFSANEQVLLSCTLHPAKTCSLIQDNYVITNKNLIKVYGGPQVEVENAMYHVDDCFWELSDLSIKHFIRDRHGDEEGVLFEFIKHSS
jgi:hypothetical protein